MHPYFKDTWHKAIEPLGKTTRRRIIAAVIEYQFTGELPTDLCATATAIFNIIILEINPEASMAVPAPPRQRTSAVTPSRTQRQKKTAAASGTPKQPPLATSLDYAPPFQIPLPDNFRIDLPRRAPTSIRI